MLSRVQWVGGYSVGVHTEVEGQDIDRRGYRVNVLEEELRGREGQGWERDRREERGGTLRVDM